MYPLLDLGYSRAVSNLAQGLGDGVCQLQLGDASAAQTPCRNYLQVFLSLHFPCSELQSCDCNVLCLKTGVGKNPNYICFKRPTFSEDAHLSLRVPAMTWRLADAARPADRRRAIQSPQATAAVRIGQ